MINKILIILTVIPSLCFAMDWQDRDTLPKPGQRILMIRESHDNQQAEMGWVVHYSPIFHKKMLDFLVWSPVEGYEKEIFELGVPFLYTP